MKLVSAKINNFRLLKDIEIHFSTDTEKNLTVIRAANESGKTTLLHALQWGLFGNDGLPNKGNNFRKSPLNEDPNATEYFCKIQVEMTYEAISSSGPKKYRIVRQSTEKISGIDFIEHLKSVRLYYQTENGYVEEEHPEARISYDLPEDLREVFFTDGDRALSFIQGVKNEPMERVQRAIRSLLGLKVYEEAINHTKKVITNLNKKIKEGFAGQEDIDTCNQAIEENEKLNKNLEENQKNAEIKLKKSSELLVKTEKQIFEALKKGDREKLAKERKQVVEDREAAMRDANNVNKQISDLFKGELIAKHFLRKKFDEANIILEKLHEKGEIPAQTVPVLKERLREGSCICGESLENDDQKAIDRRNRIELLIEDSKKSDETKTKLSSLYFSSKNLLEPIASEDETWPKIFGEYYNKRENYYSIAEKKGKRQTELENEIDDIPDVDIQKLREFRQKYIEDRDGAQLETNECKANINDLKEKIRDWKARRDLLLRENTQGKQYSSELAVATDLEKLFESSLKTMKTNELKKVSDLMNKLFLEMIGSGKDEQTDIIHSANIDENYKILVFGKLLQKIDPEIDLNGASRRTLTIAFILALTKVSNAEAPNVIDTPLGMMSGFVKQMTLQIASHQSSQLILFLTHSEIKDCEKIIEELAGRFYTFTNPAKFPQIIKNKPEVEDSRILMCDCLLGDCQQCQLSKSAENAIKKNKSLKEIFGWSDN